MRLGSSEDFEVGIIVGIIEGYVVFWILGWYVGWIDGWVVVVIVLITTDWFKIVTTNDVNKTVPIVLIMIEDNKVIVVSY